MANKCRVLYHSINENKKAQQSHRAHWVVNTCGAAHCQQVGGTDFIATGPVSPTSTEFQVVTQSIRLAWIPASGLCILQGPCTEASCASRFSPSQTQGLKLPSPNTLKLSPSLCHLVTVLSMTPTSSTESPGDL